MPLLGLLGCNELPEPRVTEVSEGVVIEVKRLGEYPSALTGMRLSRVRDEATLFEVHTADARPIDLWEIDLERGWNDVTPWRRRFELAAPRGDRFWLQEGEIWGSPSWKSRTVSFRMPSVVPSEGEGSSVRASTLWPTPT